MPIPMSDDNQYFYKRASWAKSFAVWPRTCDQSSKHIWMEWCYKGTQMITGPGEPVYLHRWVNSKEYVFAQLKGIIT